MRNTWKGGLLVGLVAFVAAAVWAQGPGGFGGPGFLLMNSGVQKELKITDEQKDKLKTALGKLREKRADYKDKFKDMSKEERQKLMQTWAGENDKAIAGVLDAKQMARLKQIELQLQGARAFANSEVQKKLNLSDEQKGKLKDITEEHGRKMRELFQPGGDFQETQKKMATLNKETMEKVNGLLSADQKKTWKEMTGEPFEFKFEFPGGGGGPRPKKNK
jgi:Spy/CpxP family protein refolding chaperone